MEFEQRLRHFQASWINRNWSLSERIGIASNPDKELFLLYLIQKIEGNDAYTARSFALIGAPKTERIPIINLVPLYYNTWGQRWFIR